MLCVSYVLFSNCEVMYSRQFPAPHIFYETQLLFINSEHVINAFWRSQFPELRIFYKMQLLLTNFKPSNKCFLAIKGKHQPIFDKIHQTMKIYFRRARRSHGAFPRDRL